MKAFLHTISLSDRSPNRSVSINNHEGIIPPGLRFALQSSSAIIKSRIKNCKASLNKALSGIRGCDNESPILVCELGSGFADWRSGCHPGRHPQYSFAFAHHTCMGPAGSSSDCHSDLFLDHVYFVTPVDIWGRRMGCAQGRKRGSSAWFTVGPGRCSHSLPLKPGLWEFCSVCAINLCLECCIWLGRWLFGRAKAEEIIARWSVGSCPEFVEEGNLRIYSFRRRRRIMYEQVRGYIPSLGSPQKWVKIKLHFEI